MLRVGLIGTSWWAEAMYLPALADHPDGRITALCGRDLDKARRVADGWDVPEVYATPEELLDRVDAVIVASSNASHHPIARAALDRGLHVLCEKPLGLDSAQADDLAAAASRSGAITMTPFTYRFMPMARQLRRHIEEGREYAPIILMVTTLHKGDETLESELPLLGVGNNMQTLGSAETYARRYGLQAIVCSSTSDKDDDGNATLSEKEQSEGRAKANKRPAKKAQAQPVAAEGGLL